MNIENLKELKENLKGVLAHLDKNINKLYKIATTDDKTGLHNYKFFKEIFEIENAKARRGAKLCLGIFDIDFFKKVNDTYGHDVGDKVLVRVARLIEGCLRRSDLVARFGGEEFVVLFPDTSGAKAKKVAERIRKKIKEKLKRPAITISGGVSEYKKADNLDKILKRADKGLYKAKVGGRDMVVVN